MEIPAPELRPRRPRNQVAFFDTHHFEQNIFSKESRVFGLEMTFFDPRLTRQTASLAAGFQVVCSFVNDQLDAETLQELAAHGTSLIALRSAGFNHVDLFAAENLGLTVVRVPDYSPHAVAEHAACLILALDRKIHKAYARVREANFSLDGLVGFDLKDKTIGIIGLGKIGKVMAKIMNGFGCRILGYDLKPDIHVMQNYGVKYGGLASLYSESDMISLHIPLVRSTHHLIDAEAITQMKAGVFLINTGRGALIDSQALINGLKSGKIGAAGLDVYEEEEGVFFKDLSSQVLKDDTLARLLTFPNVLITSHQGFLTVEALTNIARTTLENIAEWQRGVVPRNIVRASEHVRSSNWDQDRDRERMPA